MKKIAVLLVFILMLSTLSACFRADAGSPGASADPGADVELALPASVVDEGTTEELSEEDIASGIKSKKINDDGSLTITIGRADYDKMLSDMREELETSLQTLVDEGTYPSVKGISYAEDFTALTLTVDRENFAGSFDSFAVLTIGLQCSVYRIFAGDSQEGLRIKIELQDAATMKIYDTINFPESSGD